MRSEVIRYVAAYIADKHDDGADSADILESPRIAILLAGPLGCVRPGLLPDAELALGDGAGAPRGEALPASCLPRLPLPPHRLLALCDEAGLRRLVDCHMQRLRRTTLFVRAGRCFDCVAQRVADFVVEACGGPLYYSTRHARLQAGAGLPLLLDEEGRELWLVQLWHAFDDAGFPPALRADYWGWAEPLSVHLLAPQARRGDLTRYDYDTVRSWFPARGSVA